MGEVTLTQVQAMIAQLSREAAQNAGRLAALSDAVSTLGSRAREEARAAESQVQSRTAHWRRAELTSIQLAHQERGRRALSKVQQLVGRLAPGALGFGWDDVGWPDPGRAFGDHVRVGEVVVADVRSAALLPLIGAAGCSVQADEHAFADLAHCLVLRSLVAFGPARVRVHAFDPGLISDLGLYADVRQVDRASVPAPHTTNAAFEGALASLAAELGLVEDSLASLGFRTVREEALDAGRLLRPIQLLLIYGAAGEMSQQGRQTLEQLLRIGGDRGVFVLAQADALRSLLPASRPPLDTFLIRGRTSEHSRLPGLQITIDEAPRRDTILTTCQALLRRPKDDSAPVLPLEDLVQGIVDPWLDAGDEGIEVAYGRAGRTDLVLRLRSQDPPMPNAIIGGAVGEGKSNLLLDLIYGLAARYSPMDLEMVLLDLKDGVEFSSFAPDTQGRNWLPHVRVLGLEFDRSFALEVLAWVGELVQERGKAMRSTQTSNITQYRATTGGQMPRLLVVIDEFQRLFEGTDDQVDQAARQLESLARTARSAGVHIVVASQTLSGIRGLAAKADAIFAQFHNRISLKNTAAESQAILAPHNTAAAMLTYRGEVIANEGHGQDPAANYRGLSAYADRSYLRRLQARLWADGSTGVPPRIFRASAFMEPVSPGKADGLTLFRLTPGAPLSVTEGVRVVSLQRGPDQGVVVVGTDRSLAAPVLLASLTSALESEPAARVVVLDGLTQGGYSDPMVTAVADVLRSRGRSWRNVERAGIATALVELQDVAPHSEPTLLVALGLDGVAELEQQDARTYRSATEDLRQLMRTGGLNGVAVLGWWQSRARAEAQLGFGLQGVRGVAMCGLGLDDVQAIAGPGTRLPEGYPRVLWLDRGQQRRCEVLVPFAPPAAAREVLGV